MALYPGHSGGPLVSLDTSSAYDGFGWPTMFAAEGQADPYSPVGFGGQAGYYKDYTGLYLLTHRYYDAGAGRFVTRDPIGYKGGINLYGFVGNNPVNESDPDGFAPEDGKPGSNPFISEELQEDYAIAEEFGEMWREREAEAKNGSTGRALELEALLRGRNQPIIRSFPEWQPGGPITQLTPEGKFPEWRADAAPAKPYTILGRYWINRALSAKPGEFTTRQLGSMRLGFAPTARVMVRNNKTGINEFRTVTKELHHSAGRRIPGANQPWFLQEVWPWEHDAIDPQRHTGYTFLHFTK